ncbi:hypothetical protein CFP56_034409 [Quercus suber]|uniref:Uncharacterized protein n=1 Tax=Quercus suber TaxID=58331 RepID=A0AAW0JD06_QUESU
MGEQLCQICRTSGVRVSFDSTNTRDSFYRASVDFVLNVCRRAPTHCTSVQIDGEDAWKFVAGLAENICAAIIVSAAVAARTRSRLWKFKVNMLKQNLNCQRYALCCGYFLPRSLLWYLVKTLFATDECIR